MPYRKEKFDNGDVAHVTLRAIDNNIFFKDTDDYYRGIFSIYEFNNSNPVTIQKRRKARKSFKKKISRGPSSTHFETIDERDKLVEVLAFCLMPNHVHLLVKQLKDDGITKYISKVGTGIGGYFNRKNQRKGHVFQDRFYPVRIENDTQLKVVVAYIHTNPLSLIFPKWKEIRINDINKAIDFLDNEYRWSSYSDCTGKENFPSVTDRELILGLLNRTEGHKDFIKNWIENKGKSRGPSSTHFLEKL